MNDSPVLPLLLAVMLLVCIVGLAMFSVPSVDDYAFFVHAQTMSPWELAASHYMHWDGRFLHYLAIASVVRDIDTHWLPTVCWAISFLLLSFMIERHLRRCHFPNSGLAEIVIRAGLIAALLWVGMRPVIHQVVYWASAGVYTLWAAAAMAWLFVLLKDGYAPVSRLSAARVSLWFMSGLFLGASTHNLTLPLFLASLIPGIRAWKRRERFKAMRFGAACGGVIAGAALLLTAPGLRARADTIGTAFQFDPRSLWENFFAILSLYLSMSRFLLPAAVVMAILVSVMGHGRDNGNTLRQSEPPWLWFLLALATILPLLAVPELGMKKHTVVFFQVFLLMGTVSLIIPSFQRSIGRVSPDGSLPLWTKSVSILVVLVCTLIILGRDITRAAALRQEVYQRHELIILKAHPEADLVVPRINAIVPSSIFFHDFRRDPDYELNRWVARYYGVHSIRVERSEAQEDRTWRTDH